MRHFLLYIILLFNYSDSFTQCLISQTSGNINTVFSSPIIDVGSSFTACHTGAIDSILITTNNLKSNAMLKLYDASCNFLWSVNSSGITGPNSNGEIVVSMPSGGGISRNVVNGQQYFFTINTSGIGNLLLDFNNPYSGGGVVTNNCVPFAASWDMRFKVGINAMNIILPIELIYFQSLLQNENIKLKWKTTSETDNDYFSVQHSIDGIAFDEIGKVQGSGTTFETKSYELIHTTPEEGTNYYRLQQFDYDGAYEFSDVVSIEYHSTDKSKSLSVFPNPVSNRLFIKNEITEAIEVQLMTIDGKIVETLNLNPLERKDLDISRFSNGVYFIRNQIGRKVKYERLVKQ